jgi:hypothetical protein
MFWRSLIFIILLLGPSCSANGAYFQGQTYASASVNANFQALKIGGGGYVRHISINTDGTKVVATDTYGAYWWSGSAWVQLVTTNSMPPGDPFSVNTECLNAGPCGVYDIQIAPSNSNVAYMILGGYVYYTTNLKSGASATWNATTFPQCVGCTSNAQFSQDGPHIAIDPANPASVVVGNYAGLFYSTNYGGTVSTVPTGAGGVPAPTGATLAQGMLVLFDPSTTSGGSTPGLYASSYGNGVYHTGGGAGGTWSLTSGSQTTHSFMTIGPDGELYFIAGASQSLYLYNGSTWSTQSPGSGGNDLAGIAIDPAHPTFASNAYLSVVNVGGQFSYSATSGAAWSAAASTSRTCTGDIPWLCNTNESYMTAGQIAYDPSQSNVLYFTEGIGVWTTNPNTTSPIVYASHTTGIEQLVSNWAVTPPSGNPMFSFWDRPIFTQTNLSAYPSQHGLSYTYSIIVGAQVDFAKSSPTTAFVAADFFADETSGYTSNGGGTDGGPSNWIACSTYPNGGAVWGATVNGGQGWAGSVAVSTPTNFMWAMSDNAALYYTTNACATWTIAQPTGICTTTSPQCNQGWGNAYYDNRHIVCADATSGFFYAYNGGANISSPSSAGIYKFSSGGAVASLAFSGNIDNFDGANAEMNCVPGVAGEMFFASGNVTPGPYPHNESFWDCTDSAPGVTGGTITCSAVANVKEVWAFGFGKAKPGGSGYPAIFIAGWVSGVFGVYESDDHASTWTLLATNPCNSLDVEKVVTGDLNNYGWVYVGYNGSGFCYRQ